MVLEEEFYAAGISCVDSNGPVPEFHLRLQIYQRRTGRRSADEISLNLGCRNWAEIALSVCGSKVTLDKIFVLAHLKS